MVLSAYETPQLAATVFRNEMVGQVRLERTTFSLSGRLSDQLIYWPKKLVEVVGLEPTMIPACKAGAVAAVPYPH